MTMTGGITLAVVLVLLPSVLCSGPDYPCDNYSNPSLYGEDGLPTFRPLIIAHRGASGMFPEHTALAYRKAAEQGADLIECDLAITKDLKFICAHEPWLSGTTDIATREEFRDRKTTYNMDDDDSEINWNDKGDIKDEWFSFDFTLEELKTLRKHQSQVFRDPRYDGQEGVVTLDQLVDIVRDIGRMQGRTIGIYVELKHPFAVNKILKDKGITDKRFEDIALETLKDLNYFDKHHACYLQSFELTSLQYVNDKTDLKLVFLLERNITKQDWERLETIDIAGIGVDKGGLVTPGAPDPLGRGKYKTGTTDFIDQVHAHGYKAHGFTFRNEWIHLYWDHGQDPYSLLKEYKDYGIDGYFTDFPLTVRRFLHYEQQLCQEGAQARALSAAASSRMAFSWLAPVILSLSWLAPVFLL